VNLIYSSVCAASVRLLTYVAFVVSVTSAEHLQESSIQEEFFLDCLTVEDGTNRLINNNQSALCNIPVERWSYTTVEAWKCAWVWFSTFRGLSLPECL